MRKGVIAKLSEHLARLVKAGLVETTEDEVEDEVEEVEGEGEEEEEVEGEEEVE